MQGIRRLTLLAALMLALAQTSQTPAAADIVYNEWSSKRVTLKNPCTGELVDLVQESHGVVIRDKKGCIMTRTLVHASGVGRESGRRYEFNITDHSTFCDPDPNLVGSTFTARVRTRFISQGDADNEMALVTITYTLNADSSFDLDVDVQSECNG